MRTLPIALCLALLAAGPVAVAAPDRRASIAGAVGDGATLNTRRIQSVIDHLAADGGGTVVVPAGRFLTGALFLKPGVNLQLDKDAVLLGSPNIDDYPTRPTRIEGHTQPWRPALVNADRCDHLRITGDGTIQGGGKPYWDAFLDRRKADPNTANLDVPRPRNLFIRDSDDVRVTGVSLRDSGFWNLHLYRCRNVTVDRADIRTPPGAPSTDGIDVDSCQDVTVRDCYISVDDDNIALKGSKGPLADQDRDSPAVERVHIVGCTFAYGHAAVTLGSEACQVRGVLVENCRVIEPPGQSHAAHHTILLKLKLRPDTPQHYQDIHVRDVTLDCPSASLINIEPWTQYFDLRGQPAPQQLVEHVTVEDITGTAGTFGRIAAPPKGTLRDITLRNVTLTLGGTKTPIPKVAGVTLDHVTLNGAPLSP